MNRVAQSQLRFLGIIIFYCHGLRGYNTDNCTDNLGLFLIMSKEHLRPLKKITKEKLILGGSNKFIISYRWSKPTSVIWLRSAFIFTEKHASCVIFSNLFIMLCKHYLKTDPQVTLYSLYSYFHGICQILKRHNFNSFNPISVNNKLFLQDLRLRIHFEPQRFKLLLKYVFSWYWTLLWEQLGE